MTGLRVLLLDNNADALRLSTEILTANGCSVYACSACDHAGRMAALVRPRVILFHGCDGDHTAAFATLLAHAPHIPVIYFSAAQGCYEVYNAATRNGCYTCASGRYQSIEEAIRAAVVQALVLS